jgi:sulfotransferase family protein
VTRHLLVIGAQRCGTTYLYTMLDAHPDIAMARPSRPEPKVFLSESLTARGLDWYHDAYFAHAATESVLGEKSTSYLEDGGAAERARRMLGDAEIVVQLRDPVARAVSNWRFSVRHGHEGRSLDEALGQTLVGPREWDPSVTSVSPYAYLQRGRYVDYLEPWFAAFPDTLHVRFLEDVTAGQARARDLYEALGVDPTYEPPAEMQRVNQSEGSAPCLDDGLVRRLRDYFRTSDLRLAQWLGRPLPWPVG